VPDARSRGREVKIAFQGIRGAYSEAALLARFGDAEPVGYPLSEQVFDAVESGQADGGFVPVENSIVGPVGINNDLLLARDVFATAECYFPIEHCLLGRPGERLDDVKTVSSHPVALAQCRDFIDRHGMRPVFEYDTAGAAEIVAKRQTPGDAAIASKRCAGIYGLAVLAENIQTVQHNITRFLAFRRGGAGDAPPGAKTSLAFSVHHHPGALLDCLKRFAEHEINLTRLESRPVPTNPFEYVFFVDLLGGLADAAVDAALSELRAAAPHVKVIGSYPLGERPGPRPAADIPPR
jgi:prephenate dehydratase